MIGSKYMDDDGEDIFLCKNSWKFMFGCMYGIFQKYVYTADKYEKEATATTTLQFGGACLLTGLQECAAFREISEDASLQCGVHWISRFALFSWSLRRAHHRGRTGRRLMTHPQRAKKYCDNFIKSPFYCNHKRMTFIHNQAKGIVNYPCPWETLLSKMSKDHSANVRVSQFCSTCWQHSL